MFTPRAESPPSMSRVTSRPATEQVGRPKSWRGDGANREGQARSVPGVGGVNCPWYLSLGRVRPPNERRSALEVLERTSKPLFAAPLKSVELARVPGVRIPPPPLFSFSFWQLLAQPIAAETAASGLAVWTVERAFEAGLFVLRSAPCWSVRVALDRTWAGGRSALSINTRTWGCRNSAWRGHRRFQFAHSWMGDRAHGCR